MKLLGDVASEVFLKVARRQKSYSQDEDDVIRGEYTSIPAKVLARRLGRSALSIISRAHKLGVSKRDSAVKITTRIPPELFDQFSARAAETKSPISTVAAKWIRERFLKEL